MGSISQDRQEIDNPLWDLHIPRHVAVIMDGNGRWAEQRGLPRLAGHVEGRKATRRVVEAGLDFGLQALSVYAFSIENWRRPLEEVEGLMELMQTAMSEELEDLRRNNVRVLVTGRTAELPEALNQVLDLAIQETAGNTGMVFNLLIDYGGRSEIVDAARRFAEEVQAGRAQPSDLSEESFSALLYSPGLPDPDLIIRPGGEKRISNFLLWEGAYAEYVFLDVLWPDFDREHLVEAIKDYNRRQRRFGALTEPE